MKLKGRVAVPTKAKQTNWDDFVRPGDCLRLKVSLIKFRKPLAKFKQGEVFVNGKLVTTVDKWLMALVEPETVRGER